MKTNTFKLVIAFCSVSFAVNAQIKLTSDNKIGIGTTTPSTDVEIYAGTTKFNRTINGGQTVVPVMIDWQYNHPRIYPNTSHTGYFGNPRVWYSGSFDYVLYYVSCTHVSDAKFKKNIVPLNQSLDKILQLNGVRYELDFSTLGIKTKEDEPFGKIQMGLVAQDVIKILPEVVKSDSVGLSIDYTQLIPLLIEAMKEQQKQIETLQSIVTQHEEKIITLENSSSKLKSTNDLTMEELGESAVLFQNSPNPFSQSTEIRYYLPNTTAKAMLNIYDMQGTQIKSINIQYRGSAAEIINGNELKPGLYLYTLIADGIEISTKRMILTE